MTSSRSEPDLHLEPTGLARIPAQGGEPIACRHCSAGAPERLFRLTGAWSVLAGVAVWDCDDCARSRLAEIEDGSDLSPGLRQHPA